MFMIHWLSRYRLYNTALAQDHKNNIAGISSVNYKREGDLINAEDIIETYKEFFN